ncbi:MAG: UDP-N-acetylmuramoyl-L-alanine--D-glutamate ligase [Patescibacteria group bacterium]|mgnify:CR=1 FL=1
MNDWKNFFADKKVTLMGLGLLGRGIGDARFLALCGARLLVTDLKSSTELGPSLKQLETFSNITYHLGEHKEEDFTNADMVIYAAGVPRNSPYLAAAQRSGVPVYMSTALFAKFAKDIGATIVGVTGTRGKSTTTQLIYHTLIQAALRDASGREKNIFLGGTVRGISTLELIPDVTQDDIIVLELDSWLLQGFGDLQLSPDVAVFTNLMPDHLNYYANEQEYFDDKANIFKYQAVPKIITGAAIAPRIPNAIVPAPLPEDWHLQILGEHNRENASLAAEALRVLGLNEEQIKAGLESFEAVEGRLQFVREVNGIKIYNDNNATTPEATLAALKSFSQPIILIVGGADKHLPLEVLVVEMKKCKKVLLLAGTGTDRLKTSVPNTTIYRSISNAVNEALKVAQPGDVILFSPGFASFGLFKNEYDRNDQFMAAVKNL